MPRKTNKLRDDGRYKVQVYIGRELIGVNEDGSENYRKKYKYAYGYSQKEADAAADEIRTALRRGIDVTAQNDTFGDWAKRWIKIKATEVSPGRIDVLDGHIKHLNKYLEHKAVTKIKTADIQEVILDLGKKNPNTKKPAPRGYVKVTRSTAVNILQLAIDNRVMDYNPANAVKLPAEEEEVVIGPSGITDNQKRRALTQKEQQWILNTEHRAKCAAMIMMYAGLRRGELVPLTWNDIDFDNCTISVNKTVRFVKNQPVIRKGKAKTTGSIRKVKIPDLLRDYLQAEPRTSIYVCPNAKGGIHTKESFRSMWESYQEELNVRNGDFSFLEKQPKSRFDPKDKRPFIIPKITPHWLRHTFATMLYYAGYDLKDAMKQMGHKDLKTLLQIYTHLDEERENQQVSKLNDYINAGQMKVSS